MDLTTIGLGAFAALLLVLALLSARSRQFRIGFPVFGIGAAVLISMLLTGGIVLAVFIVIGGAVVTAALLNVNTCPVCGKRWFSSDAWFQFDRDQRHFDCKFVTPEA